jgi:hypothetical protein
MTILIILLVASLIWSAYQIENAPLYDEDTDTYTYKEYFTTLGIKIKKRKNK